MAKIKGTNLHKRKRGRGAGKVRRNPRVIKASKQTKKTRKSLSRDRQRKALGPGLRISRSGSPYWENRENRSDQPGKRI